MVATGHPLATAAGLETLAAGGNAVDAALAAAAVTWVTLPMTCGPGGDAFALVWDPGRREALAIGGGGRAPAGATPEWFIERGHRLLPLDGPLGVGVPGSVGVMDELARRFATMSLEDLYRHAQRHALDGFPLTERGADYFGRSVNRLLADAEARRVLLPAGHSPAPGEMVVQRDLAATIGRLARDGAESIYRGELAARIADHVHSIGGLLSADDLAAERPDVGRPPSIGYRGFEIFETALPSQGFVLLQELKILEGYDLPGLEPESADVIHLMVEAKKLAIADRNRVAGDPRFVDWSVEDLLSERRCADLRAHIDSKRAAMAAPTNVAGDTTYLCVVDGQGMAVSFIHSLSLLFGAAVMVPGTGILLNNRAGRGFSLEPGHPNRLAPGKRTISTLNAFLVTRDRDPVLVGGTPGGDSQVQWNLQLVVGVLDAARSPAAALAAPRWTHSPSTDPWQLDSPELLAIEDRVPPAVIEDLRRRGHPAEMIGSWAALGSAQLIGIGRDGVLTGASDPRDEGLALGR
jgi:gamma-glutamyltranspeptidase/glutathione hydrolase